MEYLIAHKLCDECTGINECTKYCSLHTGKAFYNFLSNIDTTETRIGEYSSRVAGGKSDLVVSGHQVFEIQSPSWILTDINTVLESSNKFNKVFDKTPVQLLKDFIKYNKEHKEEEKELIKKIKDINSNKLLIVPFKPHEKFIVRQEIEKDSKKTVNEKEIELLFVKWITNKETYKIECNLGFKTEYSGELTKKLDITNYLKEFRLASVELKLKTGEQDNDLIKITHHGIFKPIGVRDSESLVILDGTFLYSCKSNKINIIGHWNEKGKLIITNDIKTKALKKIKDNEDFIRIHRRYIAPYMMYSTNEIQV